MYHTTYKRRPGFNPVPFINILNEVANSTVNELAKQEGVASKPKANITENEAGFTIMLAIPGYKKEDIKIKIENEKLLISSEKESNSDTLKLNEFHVGKFSRQFVLPKDIDRTKIEASIADGILTVTLHKTPDAKPFTVEVK